MASVEAELPEVQTNDDNHVEIHNTIRRVLIEHERQIKELDMRLEPRIPEPAPGERPWIPEDSPSADVPVNPEIPDGDTERKQPEFGEQPPRSGARTTRTNRR